MSSKQHDRKYYMAGVGAMLLVVLLLGLRSRQAMRSVLSDEAPAVASEMQQPRLVEGAIRGIATRDSLVECARADASLRDPFAPAAAKPKARRPVRPVQKAPRAVKPSLTALIFDEVNPTVQITIGGERSDWLGRGDEFRGWQVAEIHARSVKVTKGGKEIVLK